MVLFDYNNNFSAMIDFQQIYLNEISKTGLKKDLKQQKLLHVLEKNFATNERKKLWKKRKFHGVYVYGSVGTGKSTVIDLFSQNFFDMKEMLHFSNFMHFVHEELQILQNQKNPLRIVIKKLSSEIQLLIIDEFEIFDIVNAMILGEILHEIIKNKLNLIVISNIPPHLLYKNGLQREKFLKTIALIEQSMEIFDLSNDFDYRREKDLHKEQRFFINLDVKKKFIDIYNQTEKKIFTIQNRNLILNHCIENECFLEFEEICESNLGSQDYKMIAQNFSTIYLNNIPIFDKQNQDSCARFIKFIDKIYLHKVKLFCSAKTDLQNLFQDGMKKNEFKRTLSRLIEMQASDY